MATRTGKNELDGETLDARWHAEAATVGYGPDDIDQLLARPVDATDDGGRRWPWSRSGRVPVSTAGDRTDRHPGQGSRHRTTRREGDHRRRLRRPCRRRARRAGLDLHPPPRHHRPHRHAAPHPVHKGCGTSHRRRAGPTALRAAAPAPRPDRRMGTPLDQPPPPRRRNVAAGDAATRTRPQRDARRGRGQRGPRRRRHVDARSRPGRHGAPRHHPRPPGRGRRRTRRHRQDLRHGRRPRPLHDRRLPTRRRRPLRPRRPRPRRRSRHAGVHHPPVPAPRRPRTHVTARRRGRRSRHGRHHRPAPHHHRRPQRPAPR